MKIVYLDFDDIKNPLLGAGQAKATLEVGKRLAKRGHKVTVLCSRYPGSKDRLENGIFYKHIGLGSRNIQLNNLCYFFAVPFAVRDIDADIVIECFTAPASTLFSPLFTKTPVVALPSMFNAKEFSKKYHLPFDLIERFGIKFYKYIMPYSDVDSSKAKKLNPKINFRIIPQGVGEEYFKISQKAPEYILFLSRFDIAQKGIDLLLESYALVKDEIDYPLVLAGHGPDEKRIKELVKELGLEDKVRFVGSAYGKKKYDLMSKAVFVAFPSRHDEMSLWSLEALAGGLPLVGFDLPECKWAVSDVAIKVKPFNKKEYAKALVKASQMQFISKYRRNSRVFAKRFSWEKVVDEFINYFNFISEKEVSYAKN